MDRLNREVLIEVPYLAVRERGRAAFTARSLTVIEGAVNMREYAGQT